MSTRIEKVGPQIPQLARAGFRGSTPCLTAASCWKGCNDLVRIDRPWKPFGGLSGRTENQIESRGQSARLDVRASAFEACEVHDYGK